MPLPFAPATRSALRLSLLLAAPIAVTFAATFPAHAAETAAPAAPSAAKALSVQDISVLAGTCANCHGPDGRSTTSIPTLRGVGAEHLLQRLQAFKAGTAPDATVMTRLMKGYDDSQIQALAQWFSKEAP